jgi:hypothetical protein
MEPDATAIVSGALVVKKKLLCFLGGNHFFYTGSTSQDDPVE